MRSRDLIDGFDYGEYMQRQMFCFGSDDGGGGGGGSTADDDMEAFEGAAMSSYESDYGGRDGGGSSDGGITAAQVDAMAKAQQDLFGGRAVTHGLSDSQIGYDPVTGMPRGLETVVAPGGQLVTTNLAGLTEAQRQGLPLSMEIAGLLGSDPYAYEIEPVSQNVIGQIGTPGMSLLGQGISAIQDIILGPPKTFEDLLARGAYTGMNAPIDGGRDGGSDDVRSVNPVTGRCDEGYIFDEDLQACRLDTRSGRETAPIAPPTPPAAPGTYARLGLLDVAPTGVSDFATRYGLGPQDFGAANLAYRRGAGTQFDIYRDPYQREGFTLLG
jgi:hypothetical protein